MKRIIYLLTVFVFIAGCATMTDRTLVSNSKSLNSLSLGMPRAEVLKIMGTEPVMSEGQSVDNPYRTDIFKGANKTYEILYYVSDVKINDGSISDNELTPVVLLDGKLVGWGWDFVQTLR
ncbi:MAG: DUF3192 domain-containing protein [Candidatus Omnitrophica bacterium]|jgi:outer membrane protein assembly factor BamE (lipoprotein component of BamABCDE complex)|nr:DUF3192 domain-containing protein [Candidatus Omnitrophota bacterium]